MLLFHDDTQERQYQFGPELFEDILSGCERIWHENLTGEQGNHLIIRGEVERILVYLMRKLQRESGSEETEKKKHANAHIPTAIHQAILYIQHHFRDTVSLQDVAKHVQLSPNYLSQRFHMHTGVRFQTYVQDIRLNFAETLLSASDLPITEICYASGFNTLSHFERLFKQRKGQSPSDFRKHLRIK